MIPLIKGQRKSNYDYRSNLLINATAIVEKIEGDQGYVLAHDGLTEFAETGGSARGAYFNQRLNSHFRVSGDNLEEVSEYGVVTQIGVISGVDDCSFAESFNTQAVVSGGNMWLYDGYTLQKLILDFAPIDVTWFRGVYVMTDGDSLYHTRLADETDVPILAYTSSEFAADPIKGVLRTDSNEIIAFNRYSTEYFYFNANAPTGTSVLQVISGKSSKVGIVGTHCKCFLDGRVFILGGRIDESPSIHIVQGAGEQTVATREIDKIIATYSEEELETAYMEARTVDRDKFVIIHLPNHTLLYNHTVGSKVGIDNAWSLLKTGEQDAWRAKYGIFDPRNSKWIYGDTTSNKLAYLDQQSFAQFDEAQEMLLYTPLIPAKMQSLTQIEMDTISGYAANAESCFMSLSHDGVVWSEEYPVEISKPFDYGVNFIARRLGFVKTSFSLRFRFRSKDKMAFSGLEVKLG